jgi:circadian clock protein KaiB
MRDQQRATHTRDDGVVGPHAEPYSLRLCISGMTGRSQQALANLAYICDKYLKGHYQLEVIDLYQRPERAAELQVLATPTLIKDHPLPLRHLIGNLSDTAKALRLLGVSATEHGTEIKHEAV